MTDKNELIERCKQMYSVIPEPSYRFKVGDSVELGSLKKCVVEESIEDGKMYYVDCTCTDNNYGNPYDYQEYRVAPWFTLRPISDNNVSISKNQDVKFDFHNDTLNGLLTRYYAFGIDMNPYYQRELVWDDKDKELLLDSIFDNIDIGKFSFAVLDDDEYVKRNVGYEVIDGKQRLSTIIEFYENRLPYKGLYYNDLSNVDKRVFKCTKISIADINDGSKEAILKCFLMLNRCGKRVDTSHLDAVEKMLNDIEK